MSKTRLPFQRHLEWLLLEGRTQEHIIKFYDSIQLPIPNTAYIEAAQARVDTLIFPPNTMRKLRRFVYRSEDEGVWEKHGYKDLYLKTMKKEGGPDWSGVGRMLNHPVMRVALECCLLAKVRTEELSIMLPQTFGLNISEKDIELYKHYFFDHDRMDITDWREYFKLLVNDHYTYVRLHAGLTKPQDEVLHLVGLPTKMQFSAFLKNIMATADYKFKYYSRHNSVEGEAEARRWAKLGIEAGVRHEKFSASDATDFAKLIQTEFQYISGDIETISPDMLSDIKPQIAAPAGAGPKGAVPMPDAAGVKPEQLQLGENDQNRV